MKEQIINITIFVAICLIGYLVFSKISMKEGLENAGETATGNAVTGNGIAGGAASFGATVKANVIKSQDTLLISKYRKDYETAILNLDDLVNNIMLETALSIDQKYPLVGLKKLVDLNQSKIALNSVMKFVDSN